MSFPWLKVGLLLLASIVAVSRVNIAAEPGGEQRVADGMDEDPYVWLEEVMGERWLAWVRSHNQVSQEKLEADPQFEPLRRDLLAILDSQARIPMVTKRGDYYYNFWRDQTNERGLWRRTTLEEYRKENPQWEVLLDLDKLAKDEQENWVWRHVEILRPDYRRCLISLSRGGADANVTREFDLETREFVASGFSRPEAKGELTWIDIDHVFVATDFGPGSMTDSGYPRIVKRWTRGTPLSDAQTVYEGRATDLSISAWHDDAPGYERNFLRRAIAFYRDELYLLQDDHSRIKIDVPDSASKSVFHQHLLVELREPWEVGGVKYPAGGLLVTDLTRFLGGERKFEALFTPTENSALAYYGFTKDYLLLNVLEDVKNRIDVLHQQDGQWQRTPFRGAPTLGTIHVSPVDPEESNDYFLTTTDYLTPTTLWWGSLTGEPERLKRLPEFFEASGLAISQHFTSSADGTRIPYFMVAAKTLKPTGDHPTLLYGYGGFEIALQPTYNPAVGRAWTSQGGVYVVANIRGGGEYGPRWHQAALRADRGKAYADFAAVAQDLIDRQITSPQHLGIQGGSNGGLLVGNMVTGYPDRFAAAVCQVPLLDMQRYTKLLAGALWIAEYGNPEHPEDWAFLQKYSPYHQVRSGQRYPAVLFTTSTRDDRVHPAHARKMMARMEEQGHDVTYYENIEGGHGGAANNRQSAYMQSLAYTFLRQRLFR